MVLGQALTLDERRPKCDTARSYIHLDEIGGSYMLVNLDLILDKHSMLRCHPTLKGGAGVLDTI